MANDRGPLNQARKRAKEIVKDNDKLRTLVKEARNKLDREEQKDGLIGSASRILRTFFRMIKSYLNGNYREVPWQTLMLITLAIVYFLMPFDLIPDFIPVAGFIDDATVVGGIAKSLQSDIKAYAEWESSQA